MKKTDLMLKKSKIKDSPVFHTINTILLIVISLICVLPFLNVISTALSTAGNQINFAPKGFTWFNFKTVFTDVAFWRALGVSLLVVVCGTTLSVLVMFSAAYALSKPDFPFRRGLMVFFIIVMIFSGGMVPNYIAGVHNTFAYTLEGYDKEWYETQTQRTVSYSNLPQGTYRLLVKAANNDGKWNEMPAVLEIHVLPVWYRTWWATLLFILIAIGSAYFIFRYFWSQKMMKAQIEMERIDKERQKEMNEMKLRFFINISHELRTPLTLILAPLQDLLAKVNDRWEHKQLELIKRDSVLSEGMTIMGIPSSGGVQKSICIPLEYLNGWLFKVPASRYNGERRKTIELYQRECYRVLYDYWHRGGAVNPRLDEPQASALVGKIAEAGVGKFSGEISSLLKQICERLDASTKALDRAAGRIVYLENFQPQGNPGEISEVTGRPKDRYTRGYYTSNPRAKLLAALAMIPDLPWEKCNV